jgi:D-alanyl-D-alanine carboxypeptidase
MKKMKKLRLLCCFWMALGSLAQAQVPADLQLMLDDTLHTMHLIHGSKGLGAAVMLSNGDAWSGAAGISSVFPATNVSPNDAFLIGSVTKMITAACILQLADEGLLTLNDSIGAWLDTLPAIDPNGYIKRRVTIRQLLRHQSGIYDVLSHPNNQTTLLADQDRIWTPEELIQTFINPPLFQPGATWSYSNTNYFLLSMIIKKATGNAFYQEYRERFFAPLDLPSIAIPAFEPLNNPIAHVWLDLNGDGITEDAHSFYMNYLALNSTAGAAGGYFAKPRDVAEWLMAFLRNDFVSPSLMAEAKTTVTAPGQPITYGLGLMRKTFLGLEAFGHGGDLAYAANAWYFPSRDISIVVMTNDSKKNSWTLIPIVTGLLKKYNQWLTATSAETAPATAPSTVSLSPNPFTSAFNVALEGYDQSGLFQLVLRDLAGRELQRSAISEAQGENLCLGFQDLERLPHGCYLVEVLHEGNIIKTIKALK